MADRSPADAGALVLFSGGQDSTTCLAWALERYARVETIGFDYRQRHAVELACRAPIIDAVRGMSVDWNARLGEDHMVDASVIHALGATALTSEAAIVLDAENLPTTFVPGRNLLFLVLAAAVATRRKLTILVGGMCETDFSGYPDCRDDTIKAMQLALNLGMNRRFALETPLMWLDKAATWQLAETLGGRKLIDTIRELTHTCYLGDHVTRHAWGYGCGSCPACPSEGARLHALCCCGSKGFCQREREQKKARTANGPGWKACFPEEASNAEETTLVRIAPVVRTAPEDARWTEARCGAVHRLTFI